MDTTIGWQEGWDSPFAAYLSDYAGLIGDKRTGVTFRETVCAIWRVASTSSHLSDATRLSLN